MQDKAPIYVCDVASLDKGILVREREFEVMPGDIAESFENLILLVPTTVEEHK